MNRFAAPEPVSLGPDGLAYDGHSLFYINGFGTQKLWELNPSTGAVVDADPVIGGSGSYDGLAALNGKVYVLDFGASDILEFDPVTDAVTRTLDVDALNPGYTLVGGLAGITAPNALVATADAGLSGIVEIDPATGLVTHAFTPRDLYFGVAAVGGAVFLGSPNGFIDVYSRAGTLQRTIALPTHFQVAGVDTLVKGGPGPVAFPVPAHIDIRLGAGSDVTEVFNVGLAGGLAVKESGDGADTVFIFRVTLGGSLDVDTQAGADVVVVDTVSTPGTAGITTGSGDDVVVVSGTTVGQALNVDTGEGNDFAEVDFSTVGGALTLLTRQGNDMVFLGGDTARTTTVDTADGDDILGLFDLTTGTLAASLGAGADSAFAGGVTVTAGPGADLFEDFGSNAGLTTKNFP